VDRKPLSIILFSMVGDKGQRGLQLFGADYCDWKFPSPGLKFWDYIIHMWILVLRAVNLDINLLLNVYINTF